MSEVQKPTVEEQAPVAAEAAPVEAAPVEETPAETAPAAADAKAESETKDETTKKEFEGEGLIGYKAPGGFIKKLAGFQKRFFWFGSDAVEVKSLSNYLRGEKPEVGNHNVAWSSQTGKGLLYFSKHTGEKSAPVGLINLADITDIKEDGSLEFSFVSHNQKHVFQVGNLADRDSWVAALKEKSTEAKDSAEEITGSEGYKEQLAALAKPAAVVAKAEEKKEDKAVEDTKSEDKKDEVQEDKKDEVKEDKKTRTKSRSASRKRNSIFGNFNLGSKKEDVEKVENKEEAKADVAPVEAAEAVPVETTAETPVAEAAATEETAAAEPKPAVSKRHSSLFDFKARFGSKKAAGEATPVVPAKDDEVVTSTEAPVIPAVEQSEPLATSIATPATVPTEAATNGEAAAEATEVKAERPKSTLPFGLGQKKEKNAEGQGEKPLSPFAKLRQTVKHKTSSKAAEKVVEAEKPVETEAAATAEDAEVTEGKEEAKEEPVVAAPVQTSTPVVSATA